MPPVAGCPGCCTGMLGSLLILGSHGIRRIAESNSAGNNRHAERFIYAGSVASRHQPHRHTRSLPTIGHDSLIINAWKQVPNEGTVETKSGALDPDVHQPPEKRSHGQSLSVASLCSSSKCGGYFRVIIKFVFLWC